LENNLEPSSTGSSADQLVPVDILLVSPNVEVRVEALDGFVETNSMVEELVAFKIVLEI
jgi:hypothetical protein